VTQLAELVSLSLIAAAVSRGFGRHDRYIDEDTAADIRQWTYSSALTGTVASSLARISVACLLLQFTLSRVWRFVIWAALAVQALTLTAFEITYLVQCRPVVCSSRLYLFASSSLFWSACRRDSAQQRSLYES